MFAKTRKICKKAKRAKKSVQDKNNKTAWGEMNGRRPHILAFLRNAI